MAYRLALLPELVTVHNVFHVLMLKKYVPNSSHVLSQESVVVYADPTYEERLVQILVRKEKVLRNEVYR